MGNIEHIIDYINKIGKMLEDVVVFVNNNYKTQQLAIESIYEYIRNNHPEFKKNCESLDDCFTLFFSDRCGFNRNEFLNNINVSFDTSCFDDMNYYYGMFLLKTRMLDYHSKLSLFEGVNFDININNFFESNEQLVFGTCCF